MSLDDLLRGDGRKHRFLSVTSGLALFATVLLSSLNLVGGGKYQIGREKDPSAEKADQGSCVLDAVAELEFEQPTVKDSAWPVPREYESWNFVVSGYGPRNLDGGKTKHSHNAIDISLPPGTPIVAIADGTIDYICNHKGKHRQPGCKGYGTAIRIKHDNTYTLYAHLDKPVKGLEKGTEVKKGEIIGYSGNSGISRGPHLHFVVYKEDKRHTINPFCLYTNSVLNDLKGGYQVREVYGNEPLSSTNPILAKGCKDMPL